MLAVTQMGCNSKEAAHSFITSWRSPETQETFSKTSGWQILSTSDL
jgi:hypothetical protein